MQEAGQPSLARNTGRMVIKVAVVAALCIALWFITWVLDRASLRLAWFTYGWTYGSFVNAVPVVVAFLLLLILSNRIVLALIVTLMLAVALYAANYLKLKYLDIPVSFSDIYLLGNLHLSTVKLLSDYIKTGYLVLGLLVGAGLVAVSFWWERPFFVRRSIPRLGVALVSLFCAASVVTGAGWVGSVYGDVPLRVEPFSPLLTQVHAGLISSILHTDAERRQALSGPVDTRAADAFLALQRDFELPSIPVQADQRPDIVVIQSESFFDPGILKDIPDTLHTLPNLHRALAAGIGGTMDPPTFGGGTLRTEFEVLTGIPMAAYPQVEFPYLQIVQADIPSFVHVLREEGYATVAVHANSATFWNRNVAFRAIGFQRFISKDDFPANARRDGWYISDQAMTDQIIATVEKAKAPTLVFAVSIEAHGPYLNDPVDDPARRAAIPAPPGLHGNALLEYRNYLYHIENADQQMGRLWDFLQRRGRPFVLAFYGDHLPALTHVYTQAGFDDGATGPDQLVPWFMVGSGVQPATIHIDSWMLGSDILRAAGVPLTPYYRLIAKAQAGLAGKPGGAKRTAIEQGVYALAQLRLRGELPTYLAHAGSAHDATTSNQ